MNHKRYNAACAGAAARDTLLSGIRKDLMETDGMSASGYPAASGGDAVNAAVSMAGLGLSTAVCALPGEDTAACPPARKDTGAVIGEHCSRHIGPAMEFGCEASGHAVIFDDAADEPEMPAHMFGCKMTGY